MNIRNTVPLWLRKIISSVDFKTIRTTGRLLCNKSP